jgi:lipopolysaccharide export system protein LptA
MSGKRRKKRASRSPDDTRRRGPLHCSALFLAALPFAAAFLLAALPLSAETFTYSGDSMSSELAEGSQHALLKGDARVNSENMKISADEIELFGKDFIYALCKGTVRVVDASRGIELASRELFYDRKQKIARIKGNAVMSDLKNEMVVKGGFIEDRDTEKLTVVQIGVRILKKDLVCRAEFARYWREKKILELSGMPWVSRKGDVYQAARITINLDSEEISLEGDVKGSIRSEKSEEEGAAAGDKGAPIEGAEAKGGQQGNTVP